MQHEIMYRPSYSLLKVKLSKGEVISAEAGAMVSMSSSIEIETKMKGVCSVLSKGACWVVRVSS